MGGERIEKEEEKKVEGGKENDKKEGIRREKEGGREHLLWVI